MYIYIYLFMCMYIYLYVCVCVCVCLMICPSCANFHQGVEGQQDVDLLVQVFYNGQEEDDEALMVEPDDVLQHLKNFIQVGHPWRGAHGHR